MSVLSQKQGLGTLSLSEGSMCLLQGWFAPRYMVTRDTAKPKELLLELAESKLTFSVGLFTL